MVGIVCQYNCTNICNTILDSTGHYTMTLEVEVPKNTE